MECSSCGFSNREGIIFCEECGAKLQSVCPHCNSGIPSGRKFCGECGYDLRTTVKLSSIDYDQPRSYTPKFLADKILTTRSSIEGEQKFVTILFADVAGFTSMSEKLEPDTLHEIMDDYFRILMAEVHKVEGTVNEFRGDGLMALFGAPISHEDHAQRACHAALSMQKALDLYGDKIKKTYGIEFKTRIGVNSGRVVVGAIGDNLRMDYTAQGDAANLAARMESNAEPGTVLVSENTYKLAKEYFLFESLGQIQVKGKTKPVAVYRPVMSSEVGTRIDAAFRRGLTRFVGRSSELATLKDAYEKAASGLGQVVGIVGEAGIGKSRLLLEFRNSLAIENHAYWEGQCLHYGVSMPYLPILDILRSFIGTKESEEESSIKHKMEASILDLDEGLRSVLAPLQELLSLTVDDEEYRNLEPIQKKEKTFEAIRDLLIRVSQKQPLILVIEDLHWSDNTTRELIDYVIGWLPTVRILMILLYRPDFTHLWGSKSYYRKIGLDQLSSASSAKLVVAILEGADVIPELRDLIFNRTSGNPLFMEEIIRTLLENGSIGLKDGQYILTVNPKDIEVPDTIHGVIAARIDRLEEALKGLIQVASVIGREFFFRVLQLVTGMQRELKANLLVLQGLEFIYEKSLFPELEYIFKHALTQEVAYKSLLKKQKQEIHEKVGKATETLFPDRLEQFYEMLAYHYSKSGNKEKAFTYLRLSGDKATRSSSTWEAFRFYGEALRVLKEYPEDNDVKRKRIDVSLSMAASIRLLDYPEDSHKILEEAEKVAKQLNDTRTAATLGSLISTYFSTIGQTEVAVRRQKEAFEQACEIHDEELIIQIGYDLATSYLYTRAWPILIDIWGKLLFVIEQSDRKSDFFSKPACPYVILPVCRGMALGFKGHFREGKALLDKAWSLAVELDHAITTLAIHIFSGVFFQFKGESENCMFHIEKALRICEEAQVFIWLGPLWNIMGYLEYLQGDLEAALNHIEKGMQIQNQVLASVWKPAYPLYAGMTNLELGNLVKAREDIQSAMILAQESGEREFEGLSRIEMGRILSRPQKPQFDEAEISITQGIKILEELQGNPEIATGYLRLGELYLDWKHLDQAQETLKKAETMFQEMEMDFWLGKVQRVLARL